MLPANAKSIYPGLPTSKRANEIQKGFPRFVWQFRKLHAGPQRYRTADQ
ncbi:hypothetical protein NXC24_CH01034 [Rhizobium sp. NXC24]|nr:hypothetical protein NXC24_CH01034 [Rhizobium sp. NXC24]